MADNTKVLLIGAAGVAVWWFYFRTPAAAAGGSGTPPATGGATPPATGGGTPPATGGASTGSTGTPPAGTAPALSTVQARVLAASGDPAGGLNVDGWGWYLNNELSAAHLPAAPDPMPIFQAAVGSGFDRSTPFSFGDYWQIMSPVLRTSPYGLAGLGLYLGTR